MDAENAFLSYRSLVARWLEKLAHVKTVLVAIDGLGGAGKSVIASRLAAVSPLVEVVHVDDFCLPASSRSDAASNGAAGRDYDLPRLRREVLEPSRAGAPITYRRYDWVADTVLATPVRVKGRVVLVEGVYALSVSLRALYDEALWIDCPRSIRLERGLARDGAAARARWLDDWMRKEDAYMALEQPHRAATFVCSGTHARAAEGVELRDGGSP
jgi:uridine kinase